MLLTVFIESDGAPWPWPDTPPDDPTPVKPLVIGLAVSEPSNHVAYVARPCQFLSPAELAGCDPALWTNGRFRSDAVRAVEIAVDGIKARSGASRVNLVGFSGGGAMASLVASRRGDVGCLVTIAAPLDTSAWADAIGVTRLAASMNPADSAVRLVGLPQTHFSGKDDAVVPERSAGRFRATNPGATWIRVAGFDHDCCWEREWAALRRRSCLASAG
jgi:pimeloyl-ACP methyl ester carboxylesterase